MKRGLWVLGWVLLLSCMGTVCIAQDAQRFRSDAYDYSIAIPDGWNQVPEDVVRQSFPAARDPEVPYVYDAVFAPETDGPLFSSAYMIVQVTPYSELVRDQQPHLREQDIAGVLAQKSGGRDIEVATKGRTVEDAVDVAAESQDVAHYDPTDHTYAMAIDVPVRDIGMMRGQVYGWFGDNVLVEVTLYVHASLWPKYRPLYLDTVTSFEFDEGADYERELFAELPPWLWRGGMALLLGVVIFGGVTLWRRREA